MAEINRCINIELSLTDNYFARCAGIDVDLY